MKALTCVICVIGGILLNGVTIAFAWDWFVVPLGVIRIGYVHAIGLGSLISYLTYPDDVKKEEKGTSETLFIMVLRPLIYLAIAWVIKSFM